MAKTYEEIKSEYAKDVKAYSNRIALEKSKVERLEAILTEAKAEREKYRQKDGVINHENSTMWNNFSLYIARVQQQIDEAKKSLATVEAGESNVTKLNELLGL